MLHITDGELTGPDPRNTPDMDSATAAIQKFLNYDIDQVVSYHGGLFKSNLNQKITNYLINYHNFNLIMILYFWEEYESYRNCRFNKKIQQDDCCR